MRLYLKLAWRNLWRQPRRSAIELTSIAGGVVLCMWMVNTQAGMYPKMIEEGTRMGSGHVGFYHPGYLAMRQAKMTFETAGLLAALRSDPAVKHALPRLLVPGLARSSRESRGGMLWGLDLEAERGVNPLLRGKRLKAGRWPRPDEGDGAVVGWKLAQELGLDLGKKFVWVAQDREGQQAAKLLRVRGILKTGIADLDAGGVFAPLRAAEGLMKAPGRAHELAVLLDDYRAVEAFLPRATALAARATEVEAVSWKVAMPQIADAIRLDRTSGYVFFALILLLAALGTANTMLMSVLERVREFGVARALGLGPRGITAMVLCEGLVLGATGCALGVAVGSAFCGWQAVYGIDYSALMGEAGQEFGGVLIDPVVYTGWDWPRTAVIAAVVTALALAASLYPTWRALRIRPADAMRRY